MFKNGEKVEYIGGELISSNFIPTGTKGQIRGERVYWENGIIGIFSNRTYKQIRKVG